jgi:hypothetical protein
MIDDITKHVLLENEGYLSKIRCVMALLREVHEMTIRRLDFE